MENSANTLMRTNKSKRVRLGGRHYSHDCDLDCFKFIRIGSKLKLSHRSYIMKYFEKKIFVRIFIFYFQNFIAFGIHPNIFTTNCHELSRGDLKVIRTANKTFRSKKLKTPNFLTFFTVFSNLYEIFKKIAFFNFFLK